jgi:hypothetical protein
VRPVRIPGDEEPLARKEANDGEVSYRLCDFNPPSLFKQSIDTYAVNGAEHTTATSWLEKVIDNCPHAVADVGGSDD